MWTPNRASVQSPRLPTVQSIVSNHSIHHQIKAMPLSTTQTQPRAYDSDQAFNITLDDDQSLDHSAIAMWQSTPQEISPMIEYGTQKSGLKHEASDTISIYTITQEDEAQNHQGNTGGGTDDDATSHTSTLHGMEEGFSAMEGLPKTKISTNVNSILVEPLSPARTHYVPGPLESQLAALMSKLVYIEQKQPTAFVLPDEFQEMKTRVQTLELEKTTWLKRHEAIWALRDEDVENNIRIRGFLAKACRELEETQKLRDEDLLNVQIVRAKLAEKTRECEQIKAHNGRTSPQRRRPGSVVERNDLFTAARTAALEQRVLELEERNAGLVTQLETCQGGMELDDANNMTIHKARKVTLTDLEVGLKAKDADIVRLQTNGVASGPTMDWYRMEALLEEHASYREVIGGKLGTLRSEKEVLQRDLHRKEDECQALELKVQILQRRAK